MSRYFCLTALRTEHGTGDLEHKRMPKFWCHIIIRSINRINRIGTVFFPHASHLFDTWNMIWDFFYLWECLSSWGVNTFWFLLPLFKTNYFNWFYTHHLISKLFKCLTKFDMISFFHLLSCIFFPSGIIQSWLMETNLKTEQN